MSFKIRFSSVIAIILLLSSCDKGLTTKSIKLGHGLDVTHPVHKAMVVMADEVAETSGGQLEIKVYPSQQLGTERECLELLQIGSLGMTKVSTGTLENFAPGMKIFGMPFLFRDREHFYNVLDHEVGQKLLQEGEDYWLKGLTYYDAGSRSFYTIDTPIERPEDLEGLKVRVMESATSMDMVRAFGGSPTPVSWGELYTALQQGIVDGAENNPPSFYLSRHYEVCNYYALDEHTYLPDVLIISTIVWNSLEEQEKKWITDAAKNSAVYQREIWQEAEQEALDSVKAHGVKVTYPEKEPFRNLVKDMYSKYEEDEQVRELVRQIKNIE